MKLSVVTRLFSPLSYFRIRHSKDGSYNFTGSAKIWYDYYIPILIASLIVFVLCHYTISFSIFSKHGIINSVSQMLSFLAGFYITALAAVAAFDRKDLDIPTKGIPLKIKRKVIDPSNGIQTVDQSLTRREYLCMLFGYLAFMSINLFLLGVFGEVFSSVANVFGSYYEFARYTILFVYLFFLSHIMISTFIGIFYLTERIHRE